ncbi:hypothetical protein M3210_04795 [Oceanobacillus luteolus]|nr:hypothetical protein [Oceanobacillus luteolus]
MKFEQSLVAVARRQQKRKRAVRDVQTGVLRNEIKETRRPKRADVDLSIGGVRSLRVPAL